MINLEKKLDKLLNVAHLTQRMKRFFAMYYPNAVVRRSFWIETHVILGEGTYLNPCVTVVDDYTSGECLLEIGANCSVAPGVVFAPCSSHNNSKILRESGKLHRFEKRKKIVIGNDVWIGANCTIAAGVQVGECCIIGANSFVNIDLPPYSLAYGVPVRVVENLL